MENNYKTIKYKDIEIKIIHYLSESNNDFDKKIAFTSGIFIFTTTALNKILINYLDEIKNLLN